MPNIQDIFAKTNPKVLGLRLQAARKAAGLTQEEAARRLEVARTTVTSLEQGSRLPTTQELYQFTQLYSVQPYVLLRQQPPPEASPIQFRRTPRVSDADNAKLKRCLHLLQDLCDDYLELEEIGQRTVPRVQAPVYPIDDTYIRQAGEDVAQAERNRLGLGDAPIVNLLEVIENEGVAVFQFNLPHTVAGLYTNVVHQDETQPQVVIERPCIVVNSNHPPTRRRWSLSHEYGHFVSQRNTAEVIIDLLRNVEQLQERFADTFAQAFLMPSSSVSRRYREMKQDRGKFLPSDLSRLAHYFFVSTEAMAFRLEGLGLIKPGRYLKLVKDGFSPLKANEMLGLEPHAMDSRMLPLRYQYLASDVYHRDRITEEDYARYLHLNILKLRAHDQQLRSEYTVDDHGEMQRVEVSLTEEMGA